MVELGMGTYRCREVTAAARTAIAAGVSLVDTAPVYARGNAHAQLARLLHDHPDVRVSTKAGHMTVRQADAAQKAGIITPQEAARRHSIHPAYLAYRIAANITELGRKRLDLLYLHNPEHGAHGNRDRLRKQFTQAFTVCEQAAHQGELAAYGVATWSGFSGGAFTVRDLLVAATDAAGSTNNHLRSIQLPVSLVQIASLAGAVRGVGPVAQAADAGLQVWASAPLSGGDLATLVSADLADFIKPGSTPVSAALAAVASTPGLTGALLSASTTAHWHEALTAVRHPLIPRTHLQDICRVLRA